MTINNIFKGRIKNIHFIGIGGIGMSGIARVLISSGFTVSGSDLKESTETMMLSALGAKIFIGHQAENINGADVVVFSSAVPLTNVEMLEAQKHHIPLIPRALMLAELMRLRCGIAIAGAHGKTTTTSLIGTLMHKAGLDPTVIIGGVLNHFGSNAIVGEGQFLVAEADESDGTFLHLSPTIAVITNIDAEHLDYYQGGIQEISDKFALFINSLPFYGLAVACSDDIEVNKLLSKVNRRVSTYGFNEDALYRAINIVSKGIETTFDLLINNVPSGAFTIHMAGTHNVLNSLAAIAVLEELGIKAKDLASPLQAFNGVKRRFSLIGKANNICVIDDYAHHPTEIRAVLNAAKSSFNQSKIRVLFQPHRYSRTKDLMNEFSHCFLGCDSIVITDIYAAQENPIEGITSQVLLKNIQNACNINAHYANSLEEGAKKVAELAEKDDVVLTIGAGSVTTAGPHIIDLLNEKYGVSC